VPGFLVEFGAQAAQVLGGGGSGVGGAGEAFAGALFVVESWGWEERSDMGGGPGKEGRRMEGMGMEEECTVCHVASASARCICCGSVVCNGSRHSIDARR